MADKTGIQWTETEKAYVAGLIDGEGSIYSATTRSTAYPAVVVAMTSRPVIEWLAAMLGSSVQLHNQTNLRRHPTYRPQYRTGVTGARAAALCRALLPYLRVKGYQAALVVDFWRDGRVREDLEAMPRHEARLLMAEELGYANGRA